MPPVPSAVVCTRMNGWWWTFKVKNLGRPNWSLIAKKLAWQLSYISPCSHYRLHRRENPPLVLTPTRAALGKDVLANEKAKKAVYFSLGALLLGGAACVLAGLFIVRYYGVFLS